MILINGIAALAAVAYLYLMGLNITTAIRYSQAKQAERANMVLGLNYDDFLEYRWSKGQKRSLWKALGCLGNVLVWALVFVIALG